MANRVMLLTNEDKEEVEDKVWCLIVDGGGAPMTFCTGEVFGFGEGEATYKTKTVKRGGITCERCIERIKSIKAVKL